MSNTSELPLLLRTRAVCFEDIPQRGARGAGAARCHR